MLRNASHGFLMLSASERKTSSLTKTPRNLSARTNTMVISFNPEQTYGSIDRYEAPLLI